MVIITHSRLVVKIFPNELNTSSTAELFEYNTLVAKTVAEIPMVNITQAGLDRLDM